MLGEKNIPYDVDYWDLGHGATRALRILQIIHSKTGIEVPVSVLYEAPTIETLAEVIAARKKVAFSRLVLLKPGSTDDPPLFIVSGIGAIVLELFPMGRAITYPGAVYALQPQGLNDGEVPHNSIAEMAQHYVDVIRKVQPHGPYFLSGYSIGGYVAIEMARLLEANHEQVPFLGLLDSHPYEALWPFHVWLAFMLRYPVTVIWRSLIQNRAAGNKTRSAAWQLAEASSSNSSSSSSGLLDRPRVSLTSSKRELVRWLLHSLQRFTVRYRNPRGRSFARRFSYYTSGLPANLQRVLENGFVLVAEYRPAHWDREIILFKSILGDHAQCDPMKVWPKYFPRMVPRPVPGNHRNMLHGENAVALAQEISNVLSSLRSHTP